LPLVLSAVLWECSLCNYYYRKIFLSVVYKNKMMLKM
jgi:hypothetical protein